MVEHGLSNIILQAMHRNLVAKGRNPVLRSKNKALRVKTSKKASKSKQQRYVDHSLGLNIEVMY